MLEFISDIIWNLKCRLRNKFTSYQKIQYYADKSNIQWMSFHNLKLDIREIDDVQELKNLIKDYSDTLKKDIDVIEENYNKGSIINPY